MKNKIILSLILLAAFLMLTAESCVLSTKQVEVPVRDNEDFTFTTQGGAQHSDSETVDFIQTLLDIEADNTFEALLSANIEAGLWRVVANRGDADLTISGSVTVTRVNPSSPGGTLGTAQTATLISYTSVPIASVMGDYHVAPLDAAGIDLLNAGFDEYLAARALQMAGTPTPLPDLRFRFDWQGTATSSGGTPNVDFDWQAQVKFTLVGLVEVEVPEVF